MIIVPPIKGDVKIDEAGQGTIFDGEKWIASEGPEAEALRKQMLAAWKRKTDGWK
jgi:hypothetical protein